MLQKVQQHELRNMKKNTAVLSSITYNRGLVTVSVCVCHGWLSADSYKLQFRSRSGLGEALDVREQGGGRGDVLPEKVKTLLFRGQKMIPPLRR